MNTPETTKSPEACGSLSVVHGWAPIESAPKDGTHFLAWMRESWIEVMYYDDGNLYYGSDGDAPPRGRSLPKYWMPKPASPDLPNVPSEPRPCDALTKQSQLTKNNGL